MYVRTGKMSSAFCPFTRTQPRSVRGRQQTTDREQNVTRLQRVSTGRQHRGCVTPICAVPLCLAVCCRSLRSVTHHLPIIDAAVCDRPTHLEGKAWTVWIKYEHLKCPYIFYVLWWLAEAHPRKLDPRPYTTPPIKGGDNK